MMDDCTDKLQREMKKLVDEEVMQIEERLVNTATNGEAGQYLQTLLYYNANILGYGIMQMTALQSELRDIEPEFAFQDIFESLSDALFRTVVKNMNLDVDKFDADTTATEEEDTTATEAKH